MMSIRGRGRGGRGNPLLSGQQSNPLSGRLLGLPQEPPWRQEDADQASEVSPPVSNFIAQLQTHDASQTRLIADLRAKLARAEAKLEAQGEELVDARAETTALRTKLVTESHVALQEREAALRKGEEGLATALDALEHTKEVILGIRKRSSQTVNGGDSKDTDVDAQSLINKRVKMEHVK
ncbi:hypothetical protein MIND_01273000 [Mycena indigotica]|uniref:Uncharacterized protein n=1 Tax=Mycena indigotica TaxID=2126181 RepID=A0A8H6S218_9AGAR|nr:uncharacterized protein MIND_01273000 [Mycena indigotica]KAF7291291.1 hypothetical protein MIND_01273000 [Mycena indigotica]